MRRIQVFLNKLRVLSNNNHPDYKSDVQLYRTNYSAFHEVLKKYRGPFTFISHLSTDTSVHFFGKKIPYNYNNRSISLVL